MIDMSWLDEHLGTSDEAINLANRFYWNITLNHVNGVWFVLGGEKVILRADNKESLDAFLYGLGLAYSVFSPFEIQRFRDENPFEG